MTGRPIRVLLVEDDELSAELTRALLDMESPGEIELDAVSTIEAMAAQIEVARYDILVVDWYLSRLAGGESLVAARRLAPNLPIVILSGERPSATAELAREHGAAAFVAKSPNATMLMETLRSIGSR